MNAILLVILLAAAWLFYDTAPFITFILAIVAVLTLLASAPQNQKKRHSSSIKKHDHDMSGVENLFTRLMEIISIPFKIFFRLFKIPKKK